jgi:hypothetical protein
MRLRKPKTKSYVFLAKSSREDGRVVGEIKLYIDASNPEEAEDMVRSSLPGADWSQWRSVYGVTETREVTA